MRAVPVDGVDVGVSVRANSPDLLTRIRRPRWGLSDDLGVTESPRASWRLQLLDPASGLGLGFSVLGGFVLRWRKAADGGVQPPGVEPVHVFGGGQLDGSQGLSQLLLLNQLGLVQADRGFHQRVPDGADRGVDPGLDQVGGKGKRGVL